MADEMFEIQGKELKESVFQELEARAKQLARPENPEYTWVTQRQVWFQLKSMAKVTNGAFADKPMVLKTTPDTFSQIGSESSIYNSTTKPTLPALTAIKVSKQGELGSTRKATIDLSFFTDGQLEAYEPYLLIPGMSLRLEWGWSVGANIKTAPQPIPDDFLTNTEATNKILENANNNPNYDGFQGRVTNFSINFESGLWKATVEIISAAANLASKDMSTSSGNCVCEKESADGTDTVEQNVDNMTNIFYGLHDEPVAALRDLPKKINTPTGSIGAYLVEFPARDRDKDGTQDSVTEGMETYTEETFVSLYTLADIINQQTGYVDCNNLEKNADGELVFRAGGKPLYVPSDDFIISVDPYVCILPGQMETFITVNRSQIKQQINDNRTAISKLFGPLTEKDPKSRLERYVLSTQTAINYQNDFNKVVAQGGAHPPNIRNYSPPPPPKFNYRLDNRVVGEVGNILVNTRFAFEVYKQNKTLSTFLQALMNGINDVCGNFWEFEILDITEDAATKSDRTSKLTVIDIKNASKKRTIAKTIRAKPDLSGTEPKMPVVRNLNLKTKLTEEMKSQALYAAGSLQGTNDPCANKYVYLRTNTNSNTIQVYDAGMDEKDSVGAQLAGKCLPPTGSCIETSECRNQAAVAEPEKAAFLDAVGKVLYKRTDGRVESAKTAYRQYLAYVGNTLQGKDAKAAPPACLTLAYPFDLSLTLDGIGGFRWGQYITVDRLPERYKLTQGGNTFVWQVTAVDHTITPNDWVTEVHTIPRYLPK